MYCSWECGHHGQQTMMWSYTLRGTHNKNVKGLKRDEREGEGQNVEPRYVSRHIDKL